VVVEEAIRRLQRNPKLGGFWVHASSLTISYPSGYLVHRQALISTSTVPSLLWGRLTGGTVLLAPHKPRRIQRCRRWSCSRGGDYGRSHRCSAPPDRLGEGGAEGVTDGARTRDLRSHNPLG
jgi:hypothetical protein